MSHVVINEELPFNEYNIPRRIIVTSRQTKKKNFEDAVIQTVGSVPSLQVSIDTLTWPITRKVTLKKDGTFSSRLQIQCTMCDLRVANKKRIRSESHSWSIRRTKIRRCTTSSNRD